MKNYILIGLVTASICLASVAGAEQNLATNALAAAQKTQIRTNEQIIVYYFHGTVRCDTCQKIEEQAKHVIDQQFKAEVAAKRIVFTPVNFDQPENRHYSLDYKLPCPSLVIVRQMAGKDVKWKLLGDTWKLVDEPEKFDKYIADEVTKLSDSKQPK